MADSAAPADSPDTILAAYKIGRAAEKYLNNAAHARIREPLLREIYPLLEQIPEERRQAFVSQMALGLAETAHTYLFFVFGNRLSRGQQAKQVADELESVLNCYEITIEGRLLRTLEDLRNSGRDPEFGFRVIELPR